MRTKLLFIFLVLCYNLVDAQYSEFYLPNTVDTRSSALGRTDIMSPNGSNAIFSNPALLGMISNKQLQLGGNAKVVTRFSEYTDEVYDDYKIKYPIAPQFNHISFAMPYNLSRDDIKLAFGAGYYSALDNTYKTQYQYENKTNGNKYARQISYTGGLKLISVSGAINYHNKYFAGLSLNKSLLSSFGKIDNEENSDYEITREETTKISATSLCFGAYAKITPQFSVGINYRAKFQLNQDDTEWEEDSNGTNKEGEYYNEDFDIPSIYGIGVEYKLSSGMTLTGEYHSRPFSDYKEGSTQTFGNIDDGESYRLGVEFSQSKPIYRLGLFYESMPFSEYNDDKPISMPGFTAGARFDFNNICLDGYLEFGTVKYKGYYSNNKKYDTTYSKYSIGLSAKYLLENNQNEKQQQKINMTLE